MYLSKLLSFLTQPLSWAGLLMALAVFIGLNRPRWAWRLNAVALLLVLLAGWEPLANAALRAIESEQHLPTDSIGQYEGIVVLGGGMLPPERWSSRTVLALNEGGERLVASAVLAALHPALKLIYTGREWESGPGARQDPRLVPRFYRFMGLAEGRVVHEDVSRTTLENAELTAKLPGIDTKRRWLLLTSAAHMSRSILAFERAGWNVTPYPVDFRAGDAMPLASYNLVESTKTWQIVLHEVIGRWLYAVVMHPV